MSNKPQTEKQKAHQAFKMMKAGMDITAAQYKQVCRFYPFLRGE